MIRLAPKYFWMAVNEEESEVEFQTRKQEAG